MPVSFEFVDKLTGQNMLLTDIDTEICHMFDRECDPVHFSPEYDLITDIGISCCYQGPFSIIQFHKITENLTDEYRYNILHFLDGKYFFRAWR